MRRRSETTKKRLRKSWSRESGIKAGEGVWFVGDTGVDMECAHNSGCVPVLLGSGVTEQEFSHCAPRLSFSDGAALFHFVQGL